MATARTKSWRGRLAGRDVMLAASASFELTAWEDGARGDAVEWVTVVLTLSHDGHDLFAGTAFDATHVGGSESLPALLLAMATFRDAARYDDVGLLSPTGTDALERHLREAEGRLGRDGTYDGPERLVALSFEAGQSIVHLELADGEFRLVGVGTHERILCRTREPEAALRAAATLLEAGSERQRMLTSDSLPDAVEGYEAALRARANLHAPRPTS